MSASPIISVSGLRGIVGESLTPPVAIRYVAAMAEQLPGGPVVLTHDGRASGPMLADAVRAALVAMGRDVVDAGVAATPTTGVLVRQFGAAGGVQISASHNPAPYNGLKLFGADGRVVPAEIGHKVLQRYQQDAFGWARADRLGMVHPCDDSLSEHLRLIARQVDVARIRDAGFAVLLDSNHGAGGRLGRSLLEHLGCRLVAIGQTPDGRFAHRPEPIAENLQEVCRQVRQAGVAAGFCQDPDADRLALIDAQGRYLGEEATFALCLERVLAIRPPGPVVTNCATSRMADDITRRHGVPLHRTPVGEAHVADRMVAVQAVFGGEGNGGPIDPLVGYVRDSFVGMALVLDAMAGTGRSLAELADALPRYHIVKDKVPLEGAVGEGLQALAREFGDARADWQDGLRLDWPDRWLLVRASNTEPLVRVIAEAPEEEQARGLCRQARRVLQAAR